MSTWHYVQAGVKHGPVTTEQIRAMLASGQLNPADSVWREGMAGWAFIHQVPELAPPAAQRTPASFPGAAARQAAPVGNFSSGLRIMAIIGASIALIAFFVPYFYVWATPHEPKPEFGTARDPSEFTMTGLPFGWSFWWSILIFIFAFFPLIAAILDLAIKSRTLRAINKWVMLASFSVITILALVFLVLSIFGIGLGGVYVTGKNDMNDEPRQLTTYYETLERFKKSQRSMMRNASKEERDRQEKKINDSYLSVAAIPIGGALPVIGGGLGLIASIMIITRKS